MKHSPVPNTYVTAYQAGATAARIKLATTSLLAAPKSELEEQNYIRKQIGLGLQGLTWNQKIDNLSAKPHFTASDARVKVPAKLDPANYNNQNDPTWKARFDLWVLDQKQIHEDAEMAKKLGLGQYRRKWYDPRNLNTNENISRLGMAIGAAHAYSPMGGNTLKHLAVSGVGAAAGGMVGGNIGRGAYNALQAYRGATEVNQGLKDRLVSTGGSIGGLYGGRHTSMATKDLFT